MRLKRIKMGKNSRLTPKELVVLAVCTAILFVSQIALSFLPNIELVTLLILLYTRWFQKKALFIIYAFVLLEGVFYGFHFWWFGYLYIWALLWIIASVLDKKPREIWVWAAAGGAFGLLFGFFFSLIYLLVGGVPTAVAWWIAGIPFDVLHGIGNFILIRVLFYPLDRLYHKIA